MQFIQLRFNWLLLWVVIFFVIYYIRDKETKWWWRRDIAAVTLILTSILVPFSVWGIYSLIGIENGGQYDVGSDSFSLGLNETYTSETLSNLYSIFSRLLKISTDGGNYTFYICDRNLPDVRYFFQNIYENEVDYWGDSFEFNLIRLSAPYHYSGFSNIANWTMNFYNPSQNESINVTYFMEPTGMVLDVPSIRSRFAYTIYQEPTIALVCLWIAAGFVTLLAHSGNQRTTIPEKEDNLETQDS